MRQAVAGATVWWWFGFSLGVCRTSELQQSERIFAIRSMFGVGVDLGDLAQQPIAGDLPG